MKLEQYIRPDLLELQPYTSARDEFDGEAGIFLDANENAFDPLAQQLNRYPHPAYRELKTAIARLKGVQEESIFVGNGSDEAIDLLIRATCFPGKDEIIVLPPTYGMYAVQAKIQGVNVREVPLTETFQPDVEAILKAVTPFTKLIFVCSPNNPTGNLMETERILQIINEFSGLVIVDEAYIDFASDPGWLPRLSNFENLVILQTFSKAIGMAGIRLGMAFAHPEIIAVLNKIKFPYNLNRLTVRAALRALRQTAQIQHSIEKIRAERERVFKTLEQLSIVRTVYPSQANFLLVCFHNASRVYQYLQHQGIIVRDRSRLPGCEGCIRITIGTPAENDALIEALTAMEGKI